MEDNMSVTANESTPANGGQGETPVSQEQGNDEALGEGGKKALQAERDARKVAEKSAADLKVQLDQIQQAQMSDLEKAQSSAAEFEKLAKVAQAEALRFKIAAKHGISEDDAATFLTGTDEELLTKQAERLAALATPNPTTPKPDLSQGKSGNSAPQSAADQFAAAFDGRI